MTPELANVLYLARRIVATPGGQPLLLLDRLNDLDIALWEYDRAEAGTAWWRPSPDSVENREGDPAFNGAFDKW